MENVKKYTDKVAELLILAMTFLIPVIFFTGTNDVFEINKIFVMRFLTFFVIGLWLVSVIFEKKIKLIKTNFDFPLLGYLGVSVLTTIFTFNIYVSIFGVYEDFEGILTILNYIALFYIIINFAESVTSVKKIIMIIVIAAVVISVYGLAQNFGWDFIAWNPETYSPDRFFSTLGNPNFLAAYLVEALPLIFILFFITPDNTKKSEMIMLLVLLTAGLVLIQLFTGLFSHVISKFYIKIADPLTGKIKSSFMVSLITWVVLFSPVILLGAVLGTLRQVREFTRNNMKKIIILIVMMAGIIVLFLTKSRAGMLSFIMTVLLIMIYTIIDAGKTDNGLFKKNKIWFAIFAGLLLCALFFPVVREALLYVWNRTKSLFTLNGIVLTPRVYIFKSALMMFRDHPVLGTGLDTFQVMFPYYRYPIYWQLEWNGTPEKTHNIFLQVLATQGMAGFGFFALIIVTFFKKSLQSIFKEVDTYRRYMTFGVFMACLAFMMQGLFNYTVVAYGFMFWMGLALINNLGSAEKKIFEKSFSPRLSSFFEKHRILASTIVILVIVIAQVFSARTWAADIFFKAGNIGVSLNKEDQAMPYYKQAVEWNPWREIYWVKYGIAYERLMRKTQEPQQKFDVIRQAIAINEKTIKMNPTNGYNYNNLARVYKHFGETLDQTQIAEAERLYGEAIKRDPNNAYFAMDLAVIYLSKREYDKCITLMQRYSELYPNLAMPYSYIGYAYMLQINPANKVNYKTMKANARKYYAQAVDNKQWFRDSVSEAATYSNLGVLLVEEGKVKEGINMFLKAVTARPDYREGYINLGVLYKRIGNNAEALKAYEQVLRLDPNDKKTASLVEALRKR